MEDSRNEAELEKLRLDIEIAKVTLENGKSYKTFEKTKVWLTFVTSFVAIFGLIFTVFYQQHQLNLIQGQHNDNEYSRKVDLLAKATNQQAKFAAILGLVNYIKPNSDDIVKDMTIKLLIVEGEIDTSLSIRNFISDEIVKWAPKTSLNFLIEQNRELLKPFASKKFFRIDTTYSSRLQELSWNIVTLIKCVNKLKTIENVDFSNTVLSIASFSVSKKKLLNGNVEVKNTFWRMVNDIDSVKFINSNFNNANINGIEIRNSSFKNSSFINCLMVNVEFTDCLFLGNNNFQSFKWNSEDPIQEVELENSFPTWTNCNFEASIFHPFDTITNNKFIKTEDFFVKSKWKIKKILSSDKFHLTTAGNTGYSIKK